MEIENGGCDRNFGQTDRFHDEVSWHGDEATGRCEEQGRSLGQAYSKRNAREAGWGDGQGASGSQYSRGGRFWMVLEWIVNILSYLLIMVVIKCRLGKLQQVAFDESFVQIASEEKKWVEGRERNCSESVL